MLYKIRSKVNIILLLLAQVFQKGLLYLSYYIFKVFIKEESKDVKWIIGVTEIANMMNFFSNVLKPSTTVCFELDGFFPENKYDYVFVSKLRFLNTFYKLIVGPIALAYFSFKGTHFLYFWSTSFTYSREIDLKFLKRVNKKIVCSFLGSDIRSHKLTKEYMKTHNLDHYVNYIPDDLNSLQAEKDKETLAQITDKYADFIANVKMDQISYLKKETHMFPYAYPEDKFIKNDEKFRNLETIKIVHAPSSPLYKGTYYVRSAIKKLQIEGYKFNYVELIGVSNQKVLSELSTSHIVINEFYAFIPGVFGIEGMASHCAVLTSADPRIETELPKGSDNAWMITRYWEVYDNLKYLLDNPEKIKEYADKGYDFTYKNYRYEAAVKQINKLLEQEGII